MINVENRKVGKIDAVSVMNDNEVIELRFRIKNKLTELLNLTDCNAVWINYQNGTAKDRYSVGTIAVDGDYCEFSWILGKNATKSAGKTYFVVCAQRTDGATVLQEWNSILTSFSVEKGLEVLRTDSEPYSDIFAQLTEEINKKVETIVAGTNIEVERNGNTYTISAIGEVSSDYETLQNKPSINSVELVGNKTLEQLGIQPSGSYTTTAELTAEETARINADNGLQSQIDAITVSSDVVDIVGTYQQLLNYDTTGLYPNSVIKVLQDNTHSNALSYYRWVVVENVGSWVYIGSEGPFYTKGEADLLLQEKVNITQGSTNANKLVATDSNGDIKAFTDIPTLTGRQPLDLKDNSTGHAGTVNDPVRLEDVAAGFYDIVNGGYICANPNGSNPGTRKRELPTGGLLYTDETWVWFIDVDGDVYLVDIAGTAYESWGDAKHIDYKILISNLAYYLSKTEATSTYQKKNIYITNTSVALADWVEEESPTFADYPYKATITIQGVTADTWAYIVWGAEIDEVYPDCNTVQGGVEIFASEPVALTIPTIKIEG